MTAFPRVLLAEKRCKGCSCMFVRVPDEPRRPYDPALCGFCIAQLDVDAETKAA